MTDDARRQGVAGPRLNVAAVVLAAAGFTVACGAAGATDVMPESGLIEGLSSCDGSDLPVAAFWGSTEGEGSPGRHSESPPGGDLFAMSANGAIRKLTDDAKSRDPWLSHDGRRLYFARSVVGVEAGTAAPGKSIWVRDVATGEETKLFEIADREGAQAANPEASPDGSRIIFQASNEALFDRVYVLEPGGQPRAIAMPAEEHGPGSQSEPTWRPEGEQLAYVLAEWDDQGQLWSSVRVVDLASFEETILYAPTEPGALLNLEWTTDGAALTARQQSTGLEIAPPGDAVISIDLASGQQTTVTDGATMSITASSEGVVTGIGPDPRVPRGGYEPATVLATWNGDDLAVQELPETFSFATHLTIADCAFHRED